MAESALRQLVPQSAEPFVRSYNPFNPAFRETMRASISDLLGGRAIGGTPTQRYRANIADMLTGAVEMAPGVGEAVGVTDTRQAIRSGDYGTAAILGGATALGMVLPVIGDVAGKAVRGGAPSAIRSVSQVVEDAVKSIPGLKLDVYGTPERGYTISRIEVPKDLRNTGLGTSVIRSITQAADQEGARLMLSPTSDFGGNKNRLEKFYRRLGFTRNSGRAKDFTTMETMIRPPSVASGIAGNALDMSQAARMQRARDMGFDTDRVFYHGTTSDFDKFDLEKAGKNDSGWYGRGIYLTPDPDTASAYTQYQESAQRTGADGANVLPLRVKIKNPYYWPEGRKAALNKEESEAITQELLAQGFDGVIVPNKYADPKFADMYEIVAFSPEQVRSVNAEFDPAKRGSANLLAGIMGGAVGLSALNQLVPRNEERQPD